GKIAHIFHDDNSRLRFGSLNEMLAAFASAADVGDAYEDLTLRSLPPKDGFDQATFQALIDGLDSEDEEGNSLRLRFAMDLCPDSEPKQIAELIERGDEYVRRAALERLRCIDSETARNLFAEDRKMFLAFSDEIKAMASANGFKRMNIEMLYAMRNNPEYPAFLQNLLKRVS
ncbi:MAG: hypothetical protein AAF483_30215, partial [Planctomycetota bacterium]